MPPSLPRLVKQGWRLSRRQAASNPAPFALVEVSDESKRKLLKTGLEASAEARPDSMNAFERLKVFYPDASNHFDLKEDAIQKAPLRLLCRKDHVLRFLSNNAPIQSYVAVSYCWRASNWKPARPLSKPEHGIPISPEMVDTLTALIDDDEGIWIDQCGINQTDESEKRAAIGIMDLIYRSAREIFVVLEDICLSEEEMRILDDFAKNYSRPAGLNRIAPQPNRQDQNFFNAALTKLVCARWFRRAWCSHELHCHRSCTFLISGEDATYYRPLPWFHSLFQSLWGQLLLDVQHDPTFSLALDAVSLYFVK